MKYLPNLNLKFNQSEITNIDNFVYVNKMKEFISYFVNDAISMKQYQSLDESNLVKIFNLFVLNMDLSIIKDKQILYSWLMICKYKNFSKEKIYYKDCKKDIIYQNLYNFNSRNINKINADLAICLLDKTNSIQNFGSQLKINAGPLLLNDLNKLENFDSNLLVRGYLSNFKYILFVNKIDLIDFEELDKLIDFKSCFVEQHIPFNRNWLNFEKKFIYRNEKGWS